MKKVIVLLFVTNTVFSQDTIKFMSTYNLSGSLSGGNVNRQLFSTNENFTYSNNKTIISTNPSFIYGTTGATNMVAETEYCQTISYNYKITNKSKLPNA